MSIGLKDGVNPRSALNSLDELVNNLKTVVGSSGGSPWHEHLNRYLQWANSAELLMRNLFSEPTKWTRLHSERFWQIRNLNPLSPRPFEFIDTEASHQLLLIEGIVQRLKALINRQDAAPGLVAVLDTSVLLQFLAPEQVDWTGCLKKSEVRLVLPLRVIEELDIKKYMGREEIAQRAKRALAQLHDKLLESSGTPTLLKKGVSIEVPVDSGARVRISDADLEVLDTCLEYSSNGKPVILVTGDYGMTLRAQARNIDVFFMPDKYLKTRLD
jgi:rRNA maturation endonuclease Nob1